MHTIISHCDNDNFTFYSFAAFTCKTYNRGPHTEASLHAHPQVMFIANGLLQTHTIFNHECSTNDGHRDDTGQTSNPHMSTSYTAYNNLFENMCTHNFSSLQHKSTSQQPS